MLIGTNHFDSKWLAYDYYADYGYSPKDVDHKILSEEIHIGRPVIKQGESLKLNHKEGRYFIETKEARQPLHCPDHMLNAFGDKSK